MKPTIAPFAGDPAGIGPELVEKLLTDPATLMRADVLLSASAGNCARLSAFDRMTGPAPMPRHSSAPRLGHHDQGEIAMKPLGFERSITVHGGLPIPISTPAHGPLRHRRCGQGHPGDDINAFELACRMGSSRRKACA